MYKPPATKVVDAWFDYWTTDAPASEIAEQYRIRCTTLYTYWTRAGLKQRREQPQIQRPDTPQSTCPGWSYYCAFCPVQVVCEEWHCLSCDLNIICPCAHPELKPKNWRKDFEEWKDIRARNERALNVYEYAWKPIAFLEVENE